MFLKPSLTGLELFLQVGGGGSPMSPRNLTTAFHFPALAHTCHYAWVISHAFWGSNPGSHACKTLLSQSSNPLLRLSYKDRESSFNKATNSSLAQAQSTSLGPCLSGASRLRGSCSKKRYSYQPYPWSVATAWFCHGPGFELPSSAGWPQQIRTYCR